MNKPMSAPWTIIGQFDADCHVSIMSAEGSTVCEVEPFTGDWQPEEIANARLIAAAPELLIQLKALVVQIEHSPRLIVPPNVYAAIKKAEGAE